MMLHNDKVQRHASCILRDKSMCRWVVNAHRASGHDRRNRAGSKAEKMLHNQIRFGRAAAGDQVISKTSGVAVAATHNVAKIAGRQTVNQRLGVAQRPFPTERSSLV